MSSPFGSITQSKSGTTYKPNINYPQSQLLYDLPSSESLLVTHDIPNAQNQYENEVSKYLGDTNSLTADHMVNPQVYNATYGLESTPLLQNYHNQLNALNGTLAAENLTGGSADVMSHNLLDQGLTTGLGQAANNSVLAGLQGTQDYLGLEGNAVSAAGNEMTGLGNLAGQYQTLDSNLQNQLMSPFQAYTGYQSAISPLQQQQANYTANTPTGFQQFAQPAGTALNLAGSVANMIPGGQPFGLAAEGLGTGLQAAGQAFGNPTAGEYGNNKGYLP